MPAIQKILIAPTAFKGTFSPLAVAAAIDRGVKQARGATEFSVRVLPLADGGDGTIESIHHTLGGRLREVEATGPLDRRSAAVWLDLGNTCVVELAGVCGIAKLAGKLNPMRAHTFGLGEVLQHCLHDGGPNVFIAVGGSASTDGGMAALQALRVEFQDRNQQVIREHGAPALAAIAACSLNAARRTAQKSSLTVATDVTNPLLGPNGAAQVFAPQKGATAEQVVLLEHALTNFADVLEAASGNLRRDQPGSGAAGGTAFGLASALGAQIVSGFDWLSQLLKLDEQLQWADLVISGEGRFDSQSLQGKVLGSLAQRCLQHKKPLLVLAGSAEEFASPPAGVEVLCVAGDKPLVTDHDIARTVKEALAVRYNCDAR